MMAIDSLALDGLNETRFFWSLRGVSGMFITRIVFLQRGTGGSVLVRVVVGDPVYSGSGVSMHLEGSGSVLVQEAVNDGGGTGTA